MSLTALRQLSMPKVPDLNAGYRAERAMRDLTWGAGRTMPEVPQMTQPSYRDMSLDNARREWDRMHDRMLSQPEPVPAPLISEPFQPPSMPVERQHRAESDIEGILIVVAVVAALAPVARRAAVRFQALPAKQKMIVILGVVAAITALLFI